jgi:hypothetical protein
MKTVSSGGLFTYFVLLIIIIKTLRFIKPRVGVGEAKIGRILLKNARETHVYRISSELPEKVNRRFILPIFETLEA